MLLIIDGIAFTHAESSKAPYPQLFPPVQIGDKSGPRDVVKKKPNAALPSKTAESVGISLPVFGAASGSSVRDFKTFKRTRAQALVAPSTIATLSILGGIVALATANVGGGINASGASSTN